MSTAPNSPRLIKGGIVLLDPTTAKVLRILSLQYNPDSLTRSLQIKGAGADSGDRSEALRLKGPPVETIKLEAEIDATDRMEEGKVEDGLHPELAALEVIVHPTSAHLTATDAQARSGTLEIAPALAPLTLFVFGARRILPVRITELSITEEAFDENLNPVRAKLSLGLRVLTVDDLGFDAKGGGLFLSYLREKERLASQAASGAFGTLGLTAIP